MKSGEAKMLLGPKLRITILSVLILTVFTGVIHAAWWSEKRFPVPANTEQVKEQTRKIAGSDFKFTYYVSRQDKEGIKDFYRRELSGLGWNEQELKQSLSEAKTGSAVQVSGNVFFDNNLVFKKEDSILTLTFLPEGVIKDERVRFSISEGKLELGKKRDISKQEEYVPQLMARPKKNIAPLYPKATLINFSEKDGYLNATYFTKDYIEDVADFYKNNMSGHGWSLISEIPLARIDLLNSTKFASPASVCPECSQGQQMPSVITDMWFMELVFSNPRQDSCRIGLFNNIVEGSDSKQLLNFTNIRIEYEKKK